MKIGRRAFLATGAVIAALGGAVVYLAKPFQGRQLTAAEKKACGLTVEVVEGPYFISGMIELKDGDLNFTRLAGVSIEISGHVYDGLKQIPQKLKTFATRICSKLFIWCDSFSAS